MFFEFFLTEILHKSTASSVQSVIKRRNTAVIVKCNENKKDGYRQQNVRQR